MSNNFSCIFRVLTVIAACLACIMLVTSFLVSAKPPHRTDSSFLVANDRPIVESLDRYYELVQKGKTTITVDGQEYDIFWDDFSMEEKKTLQLRLRIP